MSTAIKSRIQSLIRNKQLSDARDLCEKLCAQHRKDPEAWFLLGSTCAQTGDLDKAVSSLKKSIHLSARVATSHTNLGLVYMQLKDYPAARHSFENALKFEPNSASNLFNLANAYRATADLDKAASSYRQAISILPDQPGLHNNLAITLHEQHAYEEAEQHLLKSLKLDPQQLNAYLNLAKTCREQRKIGAAEHTLRQALTLHPDNPQVHGDLSLLLLEQGFFSEGWQEYEWRLKMSHSAHLHPSLKRWSGDNAGDQTILVTAEQGIGDEIMFASCFPDLIKAARHVSIACEPRLASIFRRSFPHASVYTSQEADTSAWIKDDKTPSSQIPAGSLPGIYRNHIQDFPDHRGYLQADPEQTELWAQRYKQLAHAMNVGISWRGGHISQGDIRSTSLETWMPLLRTPGVNFINLQYGDVQSEITRILENHTIPIHHWQDSDPLKDMDSFAAQIAALDLVISVDNSTVHLSGSLGKPTWVLQPFRPDWRWMQQSPSSYWYPSVRQFHPATRNDWAALTSQAAAELRMPTGSHHVGAQS
jgi:Tfp pilus assembly protein PilF